MADQPQWDGEPIPVERWGKDHWSTFAYVETRVVDYDGYIDARHMRGHASGWEKYATRLREPDGSKTEVFGHSDYDCMVDAFHAGLLAPDGARGREDFDLSSARATLRDGAGEVKALTHRIKLTPVGRIVAGKLRAHKGSGGNFHVFDPGPMDVLV